MQKHSLDSGNGEKNLEHFDMKMDTALMFINECLNENVDQYDEFKKNTDMSEQEIQINFEETRQL